MHYLEFERPIAELEGKIVELKKLAEEDPAMAIDGEVERLRARAGTLVADTYARLSPWQKVQVARHPGRPHFLDYANRMLDDFTPLAGDRAHGEDQAVVAGLARFRGRAIAFIGQEKGNDTQSRIKHNFGSAMPDGYRKVVRIFELAGRLRPPGAEFLPIPPVPIPALARKNAVRPKPLHARLKRGCRSRRPLSPPSSAKACRAAPSPSPPPAASICWSIRSIR